jgi:hypothetical protein
VSEEATVQTLLAFAFSREPRPDRLRAGLQRVEEWYAPRWDADARAELAVDGPLGLQLWDVPDEPCRWPAWWDSDHRVVATLNVPLGYERVVGDLPPERAPGPLAERLLEAPHDVMRLTAPFALVTLDRPQHALSLLTDNLGLGRLYEVRTDEGRFWSNRPVAALRFAGLRAEADPVGWRRMAACDWPMGDRTPYLGVRAIGAATRITVDATGHRETSEDVLSHLVRARRDPLAPETVAEVAEALTAMARSVQAIWTEVPVLSLSGGRDSRLVVAAFVAAGVEVRLKTYGAATGEAETARQLVARLGSGVEHEVTVPSAQRPGKRRAGAYQRARRWHDTTDGLRPASYLRNVPPRRLPRQQPALVTGVGGEFGHAPGYPDDAERLERLPRGRRLDAYARALQAKVVLPRGVAAHAVDEVAAQIRTVLTHAEERGVTDSKALDWFYADERLRRWGMAGESYGRVMPLLVPEFLAAAFGLSTAQSHASALHHALIARLVPAWAGVEFYAATLKERQAVRQQRLWEESDVDLLSGVIADPGDWGEAFDVEQVQRIWQRALQGQAAARDELLLQRVVWRAAFTDHLAAVNGEPSPARATATRPRSRPRRRDLAGLARSVAVRANDLPLARRIARTAPGRELRRRLGV